MPYKDPTQRDRANRESHDRQGRRHITINMDASTAALFDKALAANNDSKLATLRALLDLWVVRPR